MTNIKTHRGSCLCGLVRFEVELDAGQGTMCNCSICTKLGIRGSIVKPEALRALSDESTHTTYGGDLGRRHFCPRCGIHCYSRGHLAQLGGDYVSVNLNTLDDFDPSLVKLVYWDGRHDNWQAGPRDTPWPVRT